MLQDYLSCTVHENFLKSCKRRAQESGRVGKGRSSLSCFFEGRLEAAGGTKPTRAHTHELEDVEDRRTTRSYWLRRRDGCLYV